MAVLKRGAIIAAAVFLAALSFMPARGMAQNIAPPVKLYEQKIQAGLVYNLLKYTSWPAASLKDQKLRICLFGGDPFDGYLNPLDGRTAQQHVINILRTDQSYDLTRCHLVFIPPEKEQELPQLLQFLNNRQIMTVSTIKRFTDKGGMIEFAKQDDSRIHLYINRTALESSGLAISQRLLDLAEKNAR